LKDVDHFSVGAQAPFAGKGPGEARDDLADRTLEPVPVGLAFPHELGQRLVRVQENQATRVAERSELHAAGLELAKSRQCFRRKQFKVGWRHLQHRQIGGNDPGNSAGSLHEVHLARAAAQGLDSDRARAGVEIKPDGSSQAFRITLQEHVEQRFARPIGGWAHVQAGS